MVETVPNTVNAQYIGYWNDQPNRCEWLLVCDGSAIEFRNLTPRSTVRRESIRPEKMVGVFAVHPRDSWIAYVSRDGVRTISLLAPTADSASKRLSTRIQGLALCVQPNGAILALTASQLICYPNPFAGENQRVTDQFESWESAHCALAADWTYPTLFLVPWVDPPYRENPPYQIRRYQFGCLCPEPLKSISNSWPLITEYAGTCTLFSCPIFSPRHE